MKFLYFKGYELGGKAVDFLVGPQGEALRESVTMLGGIVIGAVSATWISVTTSFTMTAAGAKKTAKVRIEYKKDITAAQLPSTDTALSLTCSIPYVQA